jgi:hypothetical protein
MATLREYGLASDAAIGSPDASQFLTTMKAAGTPGSEAAFSSQVPTIPNTPAVISSKDLSGQYRADASALDPTFKGLWQRMGISL